MELIQDNPDGEEILNKGREDMESMKEYSESKVGVRAWEFSVLG